MYTAKEIAPGSILRDAFAVRREVFVDEQGFNAHTEIDDIDPSAHHIVLYDGAAPIATGRTFPDTEIPRTWHIGRVAVRKDCRGGTGSHLMQLLEQLAIRQGAGSLVLSAQCRVRPFYEKLGYTAYGSIYYDEFCPHISMSKTCAAPQDLGALPQTPVDLGALPQTPQTF